MSRRNSPVLISAALLAACTPDAPTEPARAVETPSAVALSLSSAEQSGLASVLMDVQERILPSLEENRSTEALRGALEALQASVESQDAARLAAASHRARAAIAGYGQDAGENAAAALADLSVVLMALDEVQEVLPEAPAR